MYYYYYYNNYFLFLIYLQFCGSIIAGLSLLSSSIMRFVNEKDKDKKADVLLGRRSLYVMRFVWLLFLHTMGV